MAVTRGADVVPHVDAMNDHHDGYNIMGALTYSGTDNVGPYRVWVFGYTRKVVGDHIESYKNGTKKAKETKKKKKKSM